MEASPKAHDLMQKVIDDSRLWAFRRLASIRDPGRNFKANEKIFLKEVELAGIVGELNCLDRLLNVLSAFPQITREDLEAELHLAVAKYNNHVAKQIGQRELNVTLEEILRTKGYYDRGSIRKDFEERIDEDRKAD